MLGNNKLEKRHYIKLTFLLFVLGFRELQQGFEDRGEHQPRFTLLKLVLFNNINVKALC
jgi:hypothetical protein|tara:strand:- start:720 stop:896 length:177 start_codon:yes stop_codon:yes gene_type:complete